MKLLSKIDAGKVEQPSRKAARSGKKDGERESDRISQLEKIVMIMAKQVLQTAQATRMMKSILMINIEVHTESHAVRTAKEATEMWETMRKKMLDEGKTDEEIKRH